MQKYYVKYLCKVFMNKILIYNSIYYYATKELYITLDFT
jgi:hypothetical protein